MSETNELMKRPKMTDEIVKARAWELMQSSVKSYLGTDWIESEADYVRKQVMSALSHGGDGYSMARALERDGWAEDRDLMDLMDEADNHLRNAHKEILQQWITVYGIAPERKIGDSVSTTHWHRKGQVGTITTIYAERAEYAVHFPDQAPTSAQLLQYEEVIDAPTEVPVG